MSLFLVLALAVLGHEMAHWLALRMGGCRPVPALFHPDRRLILSLGLGWCYDPRQVALPIRRLSYALGPAAETVVWLGGAVVLTLSGQAWQGACCVIVGFGSLWGNWWLPNSDGRQFRELGR